MGSASPVPRQACEAADRMAQMLWQNDDEDQADDDQDSEPREGQ
jgi:hypothetical protein